MGHPRSIRRAGQFCRAAYREEDPARAAAYVRLARDQIDTLRAELDALERDLRAVEIEIGRVLTPAQRVVRVAESGGRAP
jgi:hypothetical protein